MCRNPGVAGVGSLTADCERLRAGLQMAHGERWFPGMPGDEARAALNELLEAIS